MVDSHAVLRRMQKPRASFIQFPLMVTNSRWNTSVIPRLRLTLTWSQIHNAAITKGIPHDALV